tara:strand:+ start:1417 stop:2241 length:825 start_codon:yes stop_codon:yes gene_type:complete
MKINRRNFVIRLLTGVTGIFGLLVLDGFWFEKYIISWTEYDISDREDDKIKSIQITDMHLDEIKTFHHAIAHRINQEQPDVLFITGDAINYNNRLPILNNFLSLIDRTIYKVAILGNVEYSGDVDIQALKKLYHNHNGELLVNENCSLKKGNRTLNIIGLDDYIGGNANFYKAAKNVNKSLETIVLNHCPGYRDDIERINRSLGTNIKLILSGHTHGGQITFFGKVLYTPGGSGRYVRGWYESKETKMYVSKGIGTSVIPVRFGARAEASIFYI